MTNNLTDVLGVLIAFITVMLLYSMIVTTLVQATQALFRSRARNLRTALANILESVKDGASASTGTTLGSDDTPAMNAHKVLNKSDAAMLGSWKNPTGWISQKIGPQVSWLEPGELNRALKSSDLNLSDEQLAKIALKYRAMDKPLKKVFLRQVRIMTIVWAVIIAVSYQLSTPNLLKRFSAEPEFRDQIVQVSEKLLEKVDEASGDEPDKPVETDSNAGEDEGKEAVVETQTLEEKPQGDDQGAGDNEGEDKKDEAAEDEKTGEASGQGQNDKKIVIPPLFDFEAWADDDFYVTVDTAGEAHVHWDSIFGVLLTVMLLSLGAPFWFNMLKQVVNLRDTLKSASTADTGEGDAGTPNETLLDQQIAVLNQRIAATDNPVMTVSLQNELDDLRVARAEILSGT